MKTRIILFMCCIGYLLLNSCGRIHCPGFPEYLADYYPYKKNDIFSFVNQNNDTLYFWVRETSKFKDTRQYICDSPESSFIAHRLISKSLAIELGYIAMDEAGGLIISSVILSGVIRLFSDNNEKSYIGFGTTDNYWDFKDQVGSSSLLFFDQTGKDPFDPQNIALFGDSVIFENPDIQISRALIVKGEGITDFYDQKHDFHWKKIKK